MKIALTIKNESDQPMMVVEFDRYSQLRQYFATRYKKWLKDKPYTVERVHDDELTAMRAACVGLEPTTEAGYRVLKKGETIQKGDEWWSSTAGKWMTTHCEGQSNKLTSTVYRRRYAGDGYRLVDVGEKLEKGDEYLHNGKWVPTTMDGSHCPPHNCTNDPMIYRRPLSEGWPPVPSGYYRMISLEIVSRDDVYWDGESWMPSRVDGMPVGKSVGYYARPLKKPSSTACES